MSTTHVVQLVVESAGVADRLAGLVPPPESRGRRLAVGAAGACPSRRTLQRQFWKKRRHRYHTRHDDVSDDCRAARFNPSNINTASVTLVLNGLHCSLLLCTTYVCFARC